jgi:hypothetical protein
MQMLSASSSAAVCRATLNLEVMCNSDCPVSLHCKIQQTLRRCVRLTLALSTAYTLTRYSLQNPAPEYAKSFAEA